MKIENIWAIRSVDDSKERERISAMKSNKLSCRQAAVGGVESVESNFYENLIGL